MDYLDPNKQLRHRIILLTGYILIAVAITIAAMILLYQAYGFGIGKNGKVIQRGLVFFSSQPHPANVSLSGYNKAITTNTRLDLPSGLYKTILSRNGYRDWQRTIEIEGGHVVHYDYPFLFPKTLTTKPLQSYAAAPSVVSQSPDHRWLIVQAPTPVNSFDLYDLKDPTAVTHTNLALPANLVSKPTTNESWQAIEWADDNQHLLMQHIFDAKSEYVLLDRNDPIQSLNLSSSLAINPTKLTLLNMKYDNYYVFQASNGTVSKATLKNTALTPILAHVLDFVPYSDNAFLYVTNAFTPSGSVQFRIKVNDNDSAIKNLPAAPSYLLNLSSYSNNLYAALGVSNSNKVYIYKDPLGQKSDLPNHAVVPLQVFNLSSPSHLSSSDNSQYIMAENGSHIAVFDLENKKGFNFLTSAKLDPPQAFANWMDGNRLEYVSSGKLNILDYDNSNQQTLIPIVSNYKPAYSADYKYLYCLQPAGAAGQLSLTQTSLLASSDK
ncbi:MAG: hypothetical protein NVS1B10_00180 [Candidatus Saccharimonadales bacterium]